MVTLHESDFFLVNGKEIIPNDANAPVALRKTLGREVSAMEAKKGTITWPIIAAHNSGNETDLRITFDSLTSHDLTSVGIIQTARASGMEAFPRPFVLTNCHNSLCAVGGTINEDDHKFALSAAKKYGGIYVPTNLAVIHTFNREMLAGCGKMILGSDSHTRYGALGTLAVGEGGGELTKQLVGRTYDIQYPSVTAVYLTGTPQPGVGPHDVALCLIKAVFANGFVQNKVMEFIGDGVANLSVDFRHSIDVMTTETTCWSSIWKTDELVREWLAIHGREEDYRELAPSAVACYDGLVHVDLAKIEPSIAMPFHPSNVFSIRELQQNAADILNQTEAEGRKLAGKKNINFKLISKLRNGHIYVDQGIVGGCSGGTFDNIMAVADILNGSSTGNGTFSMSVYPGSQPIYLDAVKNGAVAKIMMAGALLRSAFCGPCFGAGDTPADGEFSVRHNTRNFPNREGAKPGEGQAASVALMDARSIAATARNGGRLTAATEFDTDFGKYKFFFDKGIYDKRVYNGTGKPDPDVQLAFGPNIKDWPVMPELTHDLLIKVASYITDPVTTTDELIPSGETASFRSNPIRLAEFTLGRRDPQYLGRAKDILGKETRRAAGENLLEDPELARVYAVIHVIPGCEKINPAAVGIGSAIYAHKPGDGSAREQAASCQRVLGASANLAREYATKRYRSNLINWGILPFLVKDERAFSLDDYIFFPGIWQGLLKAEDSITGHVISGDKAKRITVSLGQLTDDERQILAQGCLINSYKNTK